MFRSKISDGPTLALYDWWVSIRRTEGRLPLKDEIDPIDLPPTLLPRMVILEKVDGRYRLRLGGTRIRDTFFFEPKGTFLDEFAEQPLYAKRAAIFDKVLEDECAAWTCFPLAIPGRDFIAANRLYVPVCEYPGMRPNLIVGALTFLTPADVQPSEAKEEYYQTVYDTCPDGPLTAARA